MTLRRLADRSERGLATVEAVLVVPLVLVPILLAVVVFGRLEHTRLVVDAAAAAGARQAAVVGGDGASVRQRSSTSPQRLAKIQPLGVSPGHLQLLRF